MDNITEITKEAPSEHEPLSQVEHWEFVLQRSMAFRKKLSERMWKVAERLEELASEIDEVWWMGDDVSELKGDRRKLVREYERDWKSFELMLKIERDLDRGIQMHTRRDREGVSV